MKSSEMKTVGIIVLALGILMTVITGFTYATKEKVIDIGKVEVSKEKQHPVYWSPITGVVLVVAGIAIVVFARQKNTT